MEEKYLRRGSLIALLVGLPFAIVSILYFCSVSLLPNLTNIYAESKGGFTWMDWPIFIPLFLILFTFLLWKSGRRSVKESLHTNHGIVRRSFNMSLYINIRLFSVVVLYSLLAHLIAKGRGEDLLYFTLVFIVIVFLISTLLSTLSICMLI